MPHKLPFRIINATSQDEYHKAIEINNHTPSSKGWQSANFCLYPQDIVLSLENRCQIKKIQILSHQYLIATKIEFFVGDCPNNVQVNLNNARFTRLGYVSLSDNEKTQFKARELKSVHVDAVGRFIKLVIHTNFINKHNHYNQVGIIATNIIGDELFNLSGDGIDIYNASFNQEYISPTADLAFDMSIDPETAQIIRKLEKLKMQAVEDELYDRAKRIRDMIAYLKEVGEKLGKLEIEKRSASESENYDRAKTKKQQIDQYRYRVYQELDLQDLLNNMSHHPQKRIEKSVPETELYSQRGYNLNNNALIVEEVRPYSYIEKRPLAVLKNQSDDRPLPALKSHPDDRPLPVLTNHQVEISSPRKSDIKESLIDNIIITNRDQEPLIEENDDDVIPGMSKSDLAEASEAIELYGLPLVSRVYCKNLSYREDALFVIQKRLTNISRDTDKEDIKSEIRAASCLIKKAFKSRITQLIKIAMDINKLVLVELVDRLGVAKPEIHTYLDRVIPEVFKCIEDNKVQIKDMVMPYLVEMSQWPHVKQFPTIFSEAIKPVSSNILAKPGQIKFELLLELYSIHGLNNHYFTLDNFMKYSIQALQHKSAELRESAETLIVVLYRNEDKQIVRSYLPSDDMKTRKNVLYKRLFEKLDRIDGVAHTTNNNQRAAENESARLQKIEILLAEQQKLKDQSKSKPVAQTNKKVANKPIPPKESQPSKISNQAKLPENHTQQTYSRPNPSKNSSHEELIADLDKTCIFCGEVSDTLKENMDLHYWKNCPILRRCPHCKQAVEISSLTQHLLQECEQKSQFVQCQRCTEAVLKSDDKHFSDGLCNPANPNNSIRCPLCHENIPFGSYADSPEALWQFHLMDVNKGCTQNPRRLIAIQRQNQEKNMNNKTSSIPTTMNNNNRKSQLPRVKGK